MTWNYRIIRHSGPDTYVALHEVFYGEDGAVRGWTENPISFVGEDENELIRSLERALTDAKLKPVLVPEAGSPP